MTIAAVVGGDEATLRLAAGRAKASEMMPYLSTALFAIKPIKTEGYGTFGVDKRWRLYWDPVFCLQLSVAECAAVWLHEVGHLLREHSSRFEAMLEPQNRHGLWNCAGDAAINADLRDAGVNLPVKPWFPERIKGAERGMSTEQMYRLLINDPLIQQNLTKERKPRLILLPNWLRYDYTTPQTITAGTTEKIYTDHANTVVTIFDEQGAEQQGAVTNVRVSKNDNGFVFTLATVLAPGKYVVRGECNGQHLDGTLTIVEPTITLSPDHLARGYTAPAKVVIRGKHTRFTSQSTVELLDDQGNVLPVVSNVATQSKESMTFEVPTLPDGMYKVRVTAGNEVSEADLPIGLPYLEINPASLPSGYKAPVSIDGDVEDIVLDTASTVTVFENVPLVGPQPVQGATANVNVKTAASFDFDLAVSLPDGQYVVLVQNSAGERAHTTLTVGGDDGGGGGGGGGGESIEIDVDGEGLPDCGSGSGGQRRDHELPDGQGEDGSVDEGRGHLIRQQVARQIKEHSKSRGSVPGGWERWAEATLNPRVDWRKELNSVVRRSAATVAGLRDYTYTRPSRRSSSVQNVILPAMRAPRPPSVYLIVDTSGSMSDDMLAQCLAEIGEIIARVTSKGGDPVRVIACDASAAEVQTIKSVKSVNLTGGGGTDMRVGIKQAAEAKPKADMIIVLTDGETPWPDVVPPENPRAKYVAVLVAGEASYSQVPDFMHKIVIDDEYLSGT